MQFALKNLFQTFQWSLFFVVISLFCIFTPTLFNFNDSILSLIQIIIMMILGIFAGLSYKNNTNASFAFKNSFSVLFITSILLSLISSVFLWMTNSNDSRFGIDYIDSGFYLSLAWIYLPFFLGYIPAIGVRIFNKNIITYN